ncbi:MAG: phospholipid carrier-dependent glycosyltransferase [Candidatus Dormibacteria bacterium]
MHVHSGGAEQLEETSNEPLVRSGHGGFLGIDRIDMAIVVAFVLVAFIWRYLTPLPIQLAKSQLTPPNTKLWGAGYPYNTTTGETYPNCQVVPDTPSSPKYHQQCEGFVFDEVYFAVDAYYDLHNPPVPYFDPEPPLTKLLIAGPIAIWGFTTWAWRLSVALFGSLVVGLVYLLAMRLWRNRFFGIAAAFMMAFDGLEFVESRVGVIDIIALFFVLLTYYFLVLHLQARTKRQWRATTYVLGIGMGLALAAKLTALAPIAVAISFIGLRLLRHWFMHRDEDPGETLWNQAASSSGYWHYILMVLLAATVFVACWGRYNVPAQTRQYVYNFTGCTLVVSGTGPTRTASASLAGTTQYLNPVSRPAFSLNLIEDGAALVRMGREYLGNLVHNAQSELSYQYAECGGHPFASHWYTWPVMYHPVFMYSAITATTTADITNVGNPAVWWGAIGALLVLAGAIPRTRRERVVLYALLAAALVCTIVPFHAAEKSPLVSNRVYPTHVMIFAGIPLFDLGMFLLAVLGFVIVAYGMRERAFLPAFVVVSYLVAWYMWEPGNQARILFFYHALYMLPFMAMALAWCLAKIRSRTLVIRGKDVSLAFVAYAGLIVVFAGFLFFYPIFTGLPMSTANHAMRIWVDMQ